MLGRLVNNLLEVMWEEMAMASFDVTAWTLPRVTGEDRERSLSG
jgi:hypothetical protein